MQLNLIECELCQYEFIYWIRFCNFSRSNLHASKLHFKYICINHMTDEIWPIGSFPMDFTHEKDEKDLFKFHFDYINHSLGMFLMLLKKYICIN